MSKLTAPFTPFMSEQIYRNLVCKVDKDAPISVHLADFPSYDAALIDEELENHMGNVLTVVTLGRACRNVSGVKNRQPTANLYVQGVTLPDDYTKVVADELNVKKVNFTDDATSFVDYIIKPQMRTLGPKYGKALPAIKQVLLGVDGVAFVTELNEKGETKIEVNGQEIVLAKDDVLIESTQRSGFVSQSERDVTVVLDTNLTPELLEEGFVREIISKVQTMRKEAGFEVTDHITLRYMGEDDIMEKNKDIIGAETLSDIVEAGQGGDYEKEWSINGSNVKLSVEKL